VALFNQVDTTYRTELRELNEINFARFDDKLERRLGEFRADLDRQLTGLDAKWEKRFTELETRWEKRLVELDTKWEQRLAGQDIASGNLRAELIKWMFLFWLGTVASMAGIRAFLP
jgi:hypothetical protein